MSEVCPYARPTGHPGRITCPACVEDRLEILEAQVAAQADVITALVEHAGGEIATATGPAELLAQQLRASQARFRAKRDKAT